PRPQVTRGGVARGQRHAGAARGPVDGLHFEVAGTPAGPAHALVGLEAGAARLHGALVGHEEAGVEAHAELPDQLGIGLLVAGQPVHELARAALGDGAQVVDRFLLGQAYAVVGDR